MADEIRKTWIWRISQSLNVCSSQFPLYLHNDKPSVQLSQILYRLESTKSTPSRLEKARVGPSRTVFATRLDSTWRLGVDLIGLSRKFRQHYRGCRANLPSLYRMRWAAHSVI